MRLPAPSKRLHEPTIPPARQERPARPARQERRIGLLLVVSMLILSAGPLAVAISRAAQVGRAQTSRQSAKAGAARVEQSAEIEGGEIEEGQSTKPSVELFEGWPKPQLVLLFSGRQNGYIEPCGCTGLANQKGGLARKRTFYKSLLERGWPVAAFDVGNQVRRFGRQQEIKFQTTADALSKIGYQAVTFGPDDLKLPSTDLFTYIAGEDASTSIFICANAALIDRSLTPRYRVVEAGGKRIGVTGVIGDSYLLDLHGADLIHEPAAEGLKVAWTELERERCDLYVLLAHATLEETEALAKKFPRFSIVATAGGAEEPSYELETIRGTKTLLVQVGGKGMHVGVVGLFSDRKQPVRYERVPLDDRFKDDPEMLAMMASYQQQLQQAGLEGLGLKPFAHPTGRKFAGSAACADCHTKAAAVWSETPHAHATDSLVNPAERSEIPRHFDPECLSCHVTGWNPQKYFPYDSGYVDLEASKLLHGSGCENCHGPGAEHVAAEMGEGDPTAATIARLRKAMVLPLAKAEAKCLECHDLDNSPDFHKPGAFQEYWKQIAHPGKD
jgi:hypothetical protein